MGKGRSSVALLSAVEALLRDESNWGKGRREYRDVRGHRHYCLVGALGEAERRYQVGRLGFSRAVWALRRAARFPSVRGFNDRQRTTIRDVRRVVKEAIAAEHGVRLADLATPGAAPPDVALPVEPTSPLGDGGLVSQLTWHPRRPPGRWKVVDFEPVAKQRSGS